MKKKTKQFQDVALAYLFELQKNEVDLLHFEYYAKHKNINIRIKPKDLATVKNITKNYKIKEISTINHGSCIIIYQRM
jgi:predicted DNA binding CopG/RHH family protein